MVQLAITIAKTQGWTDYDIGTGSANVYGYVQGLAIDDQGRVWAATAGKGLKMITPDGQVTSYTTANSGLTDDNVSSIAIDPEGSIWVGYSGGLDMFAPDGSWTSYIVESSNDSPGFEKQVTAIAIDDQERVWAATAGKGVKMVTPDGQVTSYTTGNSGLVSDAISALAIDKQGRVWVGARGLSVLELDGSWKTYTPGNSGLPHSYVSALATDKEGRVWIGGVRGISVLAPDGGWKTYTPTEYGFENDVHGLDITALTIDNQNRVWIGNVFGISVLAANNQWTAYNHGPSDNLGSEYSLGGLQLAIDQQGRAWVWNFGGLSVLDPSAGVPKRTVSLLAAIRTALLGLSVITLALMLIIVDLANLMPDRLIARFVLLSSLKHVIPSVSDSEIGMISRFVIGFGGWLGLNALLGVLIHFIQPFGRPCVGGGGLCGLGTFLLLICLVVPMNIIACLYIVVRAINSWRSSRRKK